MDKDLISQKNFNLVEKIDKEYILLVEENLKSCKKSLPDFAKFEDHRIMEDKIPFNGRLAAGSIKPRFLTRGQLRHIRIRSEMAIKSFYRLGHALRDSVRLQNYFHLTMPEKEILKADFGFSQMIPFGRFDGTLTPENGLQVYELNTNCPAGGGWAEDIQSVISNFPFWKNFNDKHEIEYLLDWPKKMLRGLMQNYREWGGTDSHPDILILRWRNQYNQDSDFFTQEFQKLGHRTMIGDASQVHYDGKKLFYHGTSYKLIMRWFDLDHIFEEKEVYRDILRAYLDNAACIVNPFISSVLANKSLFAFFNDEQFASYFTKEEREILGDMCVWTRIVEKRKTMLPDGSRSDLLDYIREHKNKFLIKQSISTYGKNIFIGKEMKQTAWNKLIGKSSCKGGWIVQALLPIPTGYEPYVHGNSVQTRVFHKDVGPYLINGKFVGGLGRFSPGLVTNAMQGGGFQFLGVIKK